MTLTGAWLKKDQVILNGNFYLPIHRNRTIDNSHERLFFTQPLNKRETYCQ
jgi:hypothetical protein